MFNKNKPLYIIGDVHGCYTTLCALIESLPYSYDSQIILCGDLIDRGTHSCEVVDLAIKHNFTCILGNHEELMLEHYHKIPPLPYARAWFSNGGYETIESYMKNGGYQKIHEHLDWMVKLPRFLELNYPDEKGKNPFITHGFGLPLYANRAKKEAEIPWNRLRMYNYEKEDKKPSNIFNIFGHDIQKEPLIMKNFAAIDTACVYYPKYPSASLTALEWPSKRVFQKDFCG